MVGGAAVVILGTAALAAGLGRGELGLESTETERIRPGPVFRDCEVCPQMVVVPAGSYMMGSPASEEGRRDEEGPRHRVTIGYSLAVGVYEVTFDEWDACVEAGECWGYRPSDEGWGRGSRPVINVSWDEAKDYARWLSSETGEAYRLLSEAEWEYVARAGTETARYWGEGELAPCRYANGRDRTAAAESGDHRAADCSDGYRAAAPAGMYEPNAFGLHDVLGNVSEWTQDCGLPDRDYWGAPADGSAWGSSSSFCSQKVIRGASYYLEPWDLRSALRDWYPIEGRAGRIGFRVARTIGPEALPAKPDPPSNSTAAPFRDCEECPEMVLVPPGDLHDGFPGLGSG